MLDNSKWIAAAGIDGCPEFIKRFDAARQVSRAVLTVTAAGVYSAKLNGSRVGSFFLAPGWTVYNKRHQVQKYDVTKLLSEKNELRITVGSGWYCGEISRASKPADPKLMLIGELEIRFADGSCECYVTDESWEVAESKIRYADIYNGEHYDATFEPAASVHAVVCDYPREQLISQQGEEIVFCEELRPIRAFVTPAGEKLLDFGQEITGVVSIRTRAARGTKIHITCAEMLDASGNFYNENYRSAKSEMIYICSGKEECWQPELSFYGFRYIKVEGLDTLDVENFRAKVVCSDMRRIGRLNSGIGKLNRLFDNVVWGQKGNFVDVPTDCPQRDERLGWTGDAQVFINTACYQFDTKKFYTKWLEDMKVNQRESGAIPMVVPDVLETNGQDIKASTAWADAATVCPWQLYRHFGDLGLLRGHFDMMKRWVGYMTDRTTTPDLWTGYNDASKGGKGHFGDWLGLDAKEGSYVGSSDGDFIASAFYYYSTGLVIKAGKELGEDVSYYEALYSRIYNKFNQTFTEYKTQTECALAIYFGLAPDMKAAVAKLARLIHENGDRLMTGFVGTPYLLYALSEQGETELAYTLLLQEKFPSWLYAVNQGATTMWEHWDGKKEDGSFWSRDMNSFNHYAYGAVAGWVFEEAAGITPELPGFKKVRVAPKPDARLGWLTAEVDTPSGRVVSEWRYENGEARYTISVPCDAVIVVGGKEYEVTKGTYMY